MQSFPKWVSPRTSPSILDGIDVFLSNQMDQFTPYGPRYVQTWKVPKGQRPDDELLFRGDTYDTAITCIYFLERGNFQRAAALADALYLAIVHDSKGGGRIASTIDARSLFSAELEYCTNAQLLDGDFTSTDVVAWAGLALARAYYYIKTPTYLEGAVFSGTWILEHTRVDDAIKGFSGGEEWGVRRAWRSAEHNALVYALFSILGNLTHDDAKWDSNHAKSFVTHCYNHAAGLYNTGVDPKGKIEDTFLVSPQIISYFTEVGFSVLGELVKKFFVTDNGYEGTKYSAHGNGISTEKTAAAALALFSSGEKEFKGHADRLYESLERQIVHAPNSDKRGLVATPSKIADTGLGVTYNPWLNCASSAWTGLAFLGRTKSSVNPFVLPNK